MSNEDGKVVEVQQTEINDILEGFIPEVEPEIKNEEVPASGEEGEKRQAEEASGQKQVGKSDEEGKTPEVVPPVEGESVVEKPLVEAQSSVVEPPVETEMQKVMRENEELRKLLNDTAGNIVAPPQKELTPEQQAAIKANNERAAKQVLRFLPDEAVFDEVMKTPENFNALLTSVVNTAVERSLRLMPQVATQLVEQQMNLKTAVTSFYTDNKDLEPHKKYVGFVANEITAQHPDWGLTQILQETEKEVRNRLKLERVVSNENPTPTPTRVQQQINNPHTASSNPGFVPGGGGGRRGSSSSDGNLSSQEKDIMSLIS